MLYDTLFNKYERIRWNLGTDIDWDGIRQDKLTPFQKDTLRLICMTELGALFATEAFIRDFYNDIDFSCFVSIWYYEEMKHCLVLKRYLSEIGIEINEDELQHLRMTIPPGDRETILMIHFLSEHRLAMWYRGIAEWLEEPVIKDIFYRIANDELRHANGYFEYMKKDLAKSPAGLYGYLRAAKLMLNPKAPVDTHAVTLTGTTDLLDEPHYMLGVEANLKLDNSRPATERRVFALLSALAGQRITDYESLSALTRELKQAYKQATRAALSAA